MGFNYRNRAKQLLVFDGLDFGDKVTPTDIDGLIEWHNQKLVLIEVKLKNTPVPYGQRLALQRLVDDSFRCGKDSLGIIVEHSVFNTNEDVSVANCMVREIYYGKERQWRPPKKMMTAEQLLRLFLLPQAESYAS